MVKVITLWKSHHHYTQHAYMYTIFIHSMLQYAHAICTCNMHMQCAHAICTCNMRMQYAHAICTCNMHTQYAYAICICNMHMQYAYAICICNMNKKNAYTVCIHNMHMQYTYTICIRNMHTEYASHKNNGYSANDIKNLLGMMGIPTLSQNYQMVLVGHEPTCIAPLKQRGYSHRS